MLRLHRQDNTALGGPVSLTLVGDQTDSEIATIFASLWRQIVAFEKRFSRFLPTSELSNFNRNSGTKQTVSPAFQALLESAKAMAIETDGLYNPFILPALQRAGYTKSFIPGTEDDYHDDYSSHGIARPDQLLIDDGVAQMPLGAALDLGGCGKGYLADELAEWVEPQVPGYSISLGGDIICGGSDQHGNAWTVSIQRADADEGEAIALITMPKSRYAVATSGTNKRRGGQGSGSWHHIIDPRTKKPAITDLKLATIGATSCLKADVVASCAIIVGSKEATTLLDRFGISDALLQPGLRQGNRIVLS